MSAKKLPKSKFILKDFVNDLANESRYLNTSPENKKSRKRRGPEKMEEDLIKSTLVRQTNIKKINTSIETFGESRHKLLSAMHNQLDTRKQTDNELLQKVSEVLAQMDTDYNILKDNEKKFEHLAGAFVNCVQQTTNAHKQLLIALKEIHSLFKKQCKEMDTNNRVETVKLVDEIEKDIRNLEEKLVSATKRSNLESLGKAIFQALQNEDI